MTTDLDAEDRTYLRELAKFPRHLAKTARRDRLQKAGLLVLASRSGNFRGGTWKITAEGAKAAFDQIHDLV